MKCKFLIVAMISLAATGFSQDYMDEIATKACECLTTVSDTLEPDRFNMEIGLCMYEAATPYKKQLKKDYNIDLNRIDTQGEELGRIIGLKMASICPDALLKMANRFNSESTTELSESEFEGQIVGIDENKFVEFSVKEESGKITKFYWFTYVESNIELAINYKTLTDKFVRITFISQDYFDARIAEYRTINIIQKLELQE